jgi:hypothetical protein
MELCYWEKLSWREISQKISGNGRYISQRAAQEMKRCALDRFTVLMQFPCEDYAALMKILYEIAK